ncbi:MAG TPA: sigma-54 dependent transcriptional regulator [Pelomicrobium sp.]|nr:sigma-54 dependent transcriptional regulator [Pelomicrobium sp.]
MSPLTAAQLVGVSPEFHDMMRVVEKLAACDATVLIQGETGTGKELAARAIHYLGARREHPFIPVNCGAIPDNLFENEFFGHVRGAFTDAKDSQSGLVANAEGGTLFLDEIECLSAKGQIVLLRFLQDQIYRPLGARQHVSGNVRVIAASNADVQQLVKAGTFRQDLLYRLAIMSLTVPPLRDRPADVVPLARHFIRRFARQYGKAEKPLDPSAVAMLTRHPWPGNVRELENLIHREFLMSETPALRIHAGTLGPDASFTPPLQPAASVPFELGFRRAKAAVVAEFEKAFLARALAETGGNVSRAARIVGKERRAFGKLLKKHGIDRSRYQQGGLA